MRRALLGLILLAVLCPTARADDLPAADGFLLDAAQVIPAAQEERLEAELQDYSDRTTNQIGVAVVETIGDRSIEDYSRELFNSWGVGQADKDNGVLLVIAVGDHRTRIEVGDGLKGQVTDPAAATLLGELSPYARRGDFAGGVEHTERGIRTLLGDDVDLAAVPAPADDTADFGGGTAQDDPGDSGFGDPVGTTPSSGRGGGSIIGALIVIAVIVALARSVLGGGRRGFGGYRGYGGGYGRRGMGLGSALLLGSLLNQGRTSSPGSSSGGFSGGGSWGGGGGSWGGGGGFGGGSSGGGGASGGW